MKTITIDRAVVEKALEFIRAMNQHGWLLADYEGDMERTVAGLEAALAQEQAEPVQEPVAWSQPSALDWESHQSEKMLKVTRSRQDEYGFTQRLCTAPPKPAPLTEEEIALIDWESLKTKLDCVRAVERALEEKNRGR